MTIHNCLNNPCYTLMTELTDMFQLFYFSIKVRIYKSANLIQRLVSSLLLYMTFWILVSNGVFAIIPTIIIAIVFIFREIINLKRNPSFDVVLPFMNIFTNYFLFITLLFLSFYHSFDFLKLIHPMHSHYDTIYRNITVNKTMNDNQISITNEFLNMFPDIKIYLPYFILSYIYLIKHYLYSISQFINTVFIYIIGLLIRYEYLPGWIVYLSYIIGFGLYILSLKKGHYQYQISYLIWVLSILIIVVLQSSLLILVLFKGIGIFILSTTCVIYNDSWAYICGKLFGKHKLIQLSPNKTVEGFIGAFIFTSLWSIWITGLLSRFPILYCQQYDYQLVGELCSKPYLYQKQIYSFSYTINESHLNIFTSISNNTISNNTILTTISIVIQRLVINSIYIWKYIYSYICYSLLDITYKLTNSEILIAYNNTDYIVLNTSYTNIFVITEPVKVIVNIALIPLQLHGILFSLFASFIAPFGGFFGSAVKRVINVKNFGSIIPGHGGLTDRMDCQIFMTSFTYLYIQTMLSDSEYTPMNSIINTSIPVDIVYSFNSYLTNQTVIINVIKYLASYLNNTNKILVLRDLNQTINIH